jgi:HSP20 family protein
MRCFLDFTTFDDLFWFGTYESSVGMISRSFILPKDIDREKIGAKYEDGRLYITLEKEEVRKEKSISIN